MAHTPFPPFTPIPPEEEVEVSMQRVLPLVLGALLLAAPAMAQVQAAMFGGAGGRQVPDVFARPNESTTLYVGIYDGQTPVPNLTFTVASWGVYPQEGGSCPSWGMGLGRLHDLDWYHRS